ncbi:tetratricopeptide repeat protein, partial [Halomonas sp. BM-2019]|uniref:tetratricopeptide repeat protein n=1 Tax=Halomonas sp. BM-2019 TaxID=2811227 RepID=UPI001B3C3484
MAQVCIFLSTVSAEFRSYRDTLRHYLERPNVTVKVQEDFIVTGTETLDMLDEYIRRCDVVIHLVGDMTGAMAQAPSVAAIRERYPDLGHRLPPVADCLGAGGPPLSYTQWEAWLALYHGRRLIIAVPGRGTERNSAYLLDPQQSAAQQAHLARLEQVERHPGIHFSSSDQFAAEVWRSGLLDILIEAGLIRKIVHLPYKSLETLFKGRDALLADLARRFGPVLQRNDQPAVVKALTGMGGIGKTRLALEYAWRHAGDYPVLLLVGADSPQALDRNLAALCAKTILDLPEQSETDEGKQRDAVLAWFNQHAGWLLILDNIDTEAAAVAAEALAPKLTGGHMLLTSRLTNWSAGIEAMPVGLLRPEAAADFLLSRTDGGRRPQADDPGVAATLAGELGCLALALEQAGAYIAQRRTTFSQYLTQWESRRDEVLQWFNPRLMQYPKSVAITWQTSFTQLKAPARMLLQRLAWFAPEPIPETLLDVPVPGQEDAEDHDGALAELDAYSLVMRATDAPFFDVHRLVQDVTRRTQRDAAPAGALVEALNWVNEAFVGDPTDVRSWPVLDPLAPHVRAVAGHADQAGIIDPSARLFNENGVLLLGKALYAEAEPLMRRALAIDEASLGADHPTVAIRLNNLASLLQATNRLAEAEPLMRRALAIDEASLGADHPTVAIDLNNLAQLLQATNRLAEAEPLMRR